MNRVRRGRRRRSRRRRRRRRRRGHFGEHGCRRGRRRWWWGRRRRRRHDERRLGRRLDRRCRRRVRSGGTGGGAGVGERLRTLGRSRCSEQNVEDLAVVGQWRRARGAGVRNRALEPVGLGPACVGMGDRRLLAAHTLGVRQSRRPVHSCRGGTEFGRQDGIEGTGTQLDHRSGGEDFLFERRNVEDWFGYVCLHRWFWHACCSAPCPLRRGLDARDVTVGRTGRVLESGTGVLDRSGPRTASHDRCCTQFRHSGPLGRLRRPDPARGTPKVGGLVPPEGVPTVVVPTSGCAAEPSASWTLRPRVSIDPASLAWLSRSCCNRPRISCQTSGGDEAIDRTVPADDVGASW